MTKRKTMKPAARAPKPKVLAFTNDELATIIRAAVENRFARLRAEMREAAQIDAQIADHETRDCGPAMYGTAGECAPPKRETPIDMTMQAAGAVEGLVERVLTLSARLVGSAPEKAGAEGTSGGMPSSLLGQLDVIARCSLHSISRAHEALSRIERELP